MTTSNTSSLDYGKLAYDRTEIAETLYRFIRGIDLGDADLLTSSLTADVVFDFTPAANKIGRAFPVLLSREVVVGTIMATLGPLDTSHTVSNLHVTIKGEGATLNAYVMAQHFLPGEGPRPDCSRHALFMNRYDVDLVRDGDTWRISRVTIDNAWFEGDPTLL
jgi:hypothetical protein